MSKTLVMKFGGTSVGSAAAIRSVVDIVRQNSQHREQPGVAIRGEAGIHAPEVFGRRVGEGLAQPVDLRVPERRFRFR